MDKITIERETLERLVRWIGGSRAIIETDLFNDLRAALAAQPASAAVPPGYALVPIEPTHNMLCALTQEWHSSRHDAMKARYRAMIAAAGDKP